VRCRDCDYEGQALVQHALATGHGAFAGASGATFVVLDEPATAPHPDYVRSYGDLHLGGVVPPPPEKEETP